jgi:hypothetical protein
VYEFLENALNVRWYGPGDIGLSYKQSKTVTCPTIDIRRAPRCKSRRMLFYGRMDKKGSEFRVWQRRLKLDEGDMSYIMFGHTTLFAQAFASLRPDQLEIGTEEYLQWHKQMVKEGKRAEIPAVWGLKLNSNGTFFGNHSLFRQHPCFSKEELIKTTISTAKSFLDGKGQGHGFTGWGVMHGNSIALNPSDQLIQCQCEQCKPQYDLTPKMLEAMKYVAGGGTASDLIFGFYNKIAEALLKSHPEARVNVMAYLDHAYPPQKITKLPRNMRVSVALYPYESWNPGATQNDRAIWREWIERFPEVPKGVVLYLDNTPPPPFPYMNVHYWLANMRWYLNTGADSFAMYRNPAQLMPETYILARMADDPAVDENALLKEYFDHYWGAAAGPIQNVFGLFESIQNNPDNFPAEAFKPLTQENFPRFGGDGKILYERLLTGERVAKITEWLEEARRLAVDPAEKKRVEWFENTILEPVLDGKRAYDKNRAEALLPLPKPELAKRPATGRYVRVEQKKQYLCIAEVEVYSGGRNVALKQKASQSSVSEWGGPPELAVDGNTSGDWNDGSVIHTGNGTDEWWEVDLGGSFPIEKIVFYDRVHDPEWVETVKVSILDGQRQTVWEKPIGRRLDKHGNRIEF